MTKKVPRLTKPNPLLEINGANIILREFTMELLETSDYLAWVRDPEVMVTIYRMEYLMPINPESIRDYVKGLIGSDRDAYFAIHDRASEKCIGTLRIGHIDWRVGTGDIGILVGDREFWGKGIATDAVGAAAKYSFSFLSLRKLTGGCAASNVAMCRCFERLGFKREATLRRQLLLQGEYTDHALYGLFPDELAVSDDGK